MILYTTHTMSSENFYNTIAEAYDSYCTISGIHKHTTKEIQLIDTYSPQTILEIGVGTGRLARAYTTVHPNVIYVGIDNSATMLSLAPPMDATLILADMASYLEHCTETGKHFDVIIAPYTAIHHAEQAKQFELFESMKRLTDVIIINCLTKSEESTLFHGRDAAEVVFPLPGGARPSTTVYALHVNIRKQTKTHPESDLREFLVWEKSTQPE